MILEGRDVVGQPIVISPGQRLVGNAALALKQHVRSAVSAGVDVILEFGEVSFVDSSGLGALVVAFRTAKNAGRRLSLCSVPEHVLALLKLTRLHRIFTIHPDVETARLLLDTIR